MNLTALFLAACLQTSLPCDDITVILEPIKGRAEGEARLYNTGRMEIAISPFVPSDQVAGVITHEIAHLIAFQRGDYRHGKTWLNLCNDLSKQFKTSRSACYQ